MIGPKQTYEKDPLAQSSVPINQPIAPRPPQPSVRPDIPIDPETRLKHINDELAKQQGWYNQIGVTGYRDLLRQIDPMKSKQYEQIWSKRASDPESDYDSWHEFTQREEGSLRNQIMAAIARLNSEKEKTYQQALENRRNMYAGQEQTAREGLTTTRNSLINSIIGAEEANITEAGYQGGLARQQTGAALAERGMDRSTLGSRAINEITQNELQAKLAAREQSAGIQQQLNTGVENQLKAIKQRREDIANKKDLAEMQAAGDQAFEIDMNKIRMDYENQINQLKLDAQKRSMLGGLAGSILGAAAGIFIGQPAAGAAVGSKVGGSV